MEWSRCFTLDAYLKKTDDVLLNVQLSNSLPITSIQTNAGSIENRGIDFSVATVNTVKEFKWNTEFNISFNKNRVTGSSTPMFIISAVFTAITPMFPL